MKWQIQLFLLPEDEEALSVRMLRLYPKLSFVDGGSWPSPEPPVKRTIAECLQRYSYLWPKWLYERLPSVRRADGTFDGPESGLVVQVCRSQGPKEFSISSIRPPVLALSSGRAAWGGDASLEKFEHMKEFVKTFRREINAQCSSKLIALDPRTRRPVLQEVVARYRVGDYAAQWCRSETNNFLKDRSVSLFFRPA